NLSLSDVQTAVANANVNDPKGSFDGQLRSFTVDANDQLKSAEEYRNMIVMWRNNAPIRLRQLAEVSDGAENAYLAAWVNEQPAVIVNIQRQPGANVIEVVDRIKNLLPQLQ
ncbi:MAG: efflux RND transporter permease subunit, partial [Fluviibacter sp.]